jgi:hypothetical protein
MWWVKKVMLVCSGSSVNCAGSAFAGLTTSQARSTPALTLRPIVK